MGGLLPDLVAWVTDVIASFGYLGVGLLIALETVFPLIPSEVILPLAGSLVAKGRFSFFWLVPAATAGSVAGSLVFYGAGWWLSGDRLHRFIRRFGRFALIDESDLDRAQYWFNAHGGGAVLIGRLVPGIRSLISIPAGTGRMPVLWFVLYTAIGSAIWNGALIAIGWVLGNQWDLVRGYVQILEYLVLGGVVVAVVWFIWRRAVSLKQD